MNKKFQSCHFPGGISNSGVEAKWPPLDDYQAPQRSQEHFVVAPTTNTISKGNIISILPPPPINYNRAPRNIFSPSIKITPSSTTTARPSLVKYSQPNLGFVPVTPSWLRTSTTTPRPVRFRQKPNTIMTVKHGIIPILKSRLQQQRRQRARHKTPRLYKYFAK